MWPQKSHPSSSESRCHANWGGQGERRHSGFHGWRFWCSLPLIHVRCSRLRLLAWLILNIGQEKKKIRSWFAPRGGNVTARKLTAMTEIHCNLLKRRVTKVVCLLRLLTRLLFLHVCTFFSSEESHWRHLLGVADVGKQNGSCFSGGGASSRRPRSIWEETLKASDEPHERTSVDFQLSWIKDKRNVCKMTTALQPDCVNLIQALTKGCARLFYLLLSCFYFPHQNL